MKLVKRPQAFVLLCIGLALRIVVANGQVAFLPDQFFDSNGVRIRYAELGTGEPLILVHGASTSFEPSWGDGNVYQELAKYYRVIGIDLRGHGKSAKPHDPEMYGDEMALDIVRLLDHLRLAKAHIMGYSQGGMMTAMAIALRPERFQTAIIGGAVSRFG